MGEIAIMSDILKKGYKVAIPYGEDWDFDLLVLKDEKNGKFERLQCKYVKSDGRTIIVSCRSTNNWKTKKYTSQTVDWIAVYDETTDKCYYIPSKEFEQGRAAITLRLVSPKNNQKAKIKWAKDYLNF